MLHALQQQVSICRSHPVLVATTALRNSRDEAARRVSLGAECIRQTPRAEISMSSAAAVNASKFHHMLQLYIAKNKCCYSFHHMLQLYMLRTVPVWFSSVSGNPAAAFQGCRFLVFGLQSARAPDRKQASGSHHAAPMGASSLLPCTRSGNSSHN